MMSSGQEPCGQAREGGKSGVGEESHVYVCTHSSVTHIKPHMAVEVNIGNTKFSPSTLYCRNIATVSDDS